MMPSEALNILDEKGLRPPRLLTLAITGACNLSCRHCWIDAGRPSSPDHVPASTLRRLIKEFLTLGGEGIRFTGGEPLCHPDWLDILRFCRSTGLQSVSIQTNAILFTRDAIAALRDLDFPHLALQISLDGATAESHDLVRGAGAFAGVMAGLNLLCQEGLAKQVTLFFTELAHNLAEIPALLRLADDLGVGSVVTGSLVLCGRAAEDPLMAPPVIEQYEELLSRFETDPDFRRLYERIGCVAALEWQRESAPRTTCCTFVENPYLTADGMLYPCVLCHADGYAVSGLFDKQLATAFAEGAPLWSSLLELSQRRAESSPACRECPGKSVCAGGCMGRAWGSCGDLLAVDDRCELRRVIYRRNPVIYF